MLETKYDILTTDTLIRAVQISHIMLSDPDWKKKMSQKKYSSIKRDLGEMRIVLFERLPLQDRTRKEFFPIDSHVEYKPDMYSTSRNGQVKMYGALNSLVVILEGDVHWTEVSPSCCTLKFIRNSLL